MGSEDKMTIVNQDYDPKYKKQILELFKKTYNKEMSESFWNWRFQQYPFGKPLVRLSLFNDKIVAHYLLQPAKLLIESKETNALYSMTTMTDPDFSGRGLMTLLANEVYEMGRKQNYDFIFGFANKNSKHMFSKKLGFQIFTIPELSISVENQRYVKQKCVCSNIDHFDNLYSKFYKEFVKANRSKIMRNRTTDYMNWRFINHPENQYYCYKITLDTDVLGYFVLKNYDNIKCHIVDFMTLENKYCYNAMIDTALQFCKTNNIDQLTLWVNKTLPFYDYLCEIGLTQNLSETHFCIKKLSSKNADVDIEKLDNWHITMADSDVF